MNRTQFTSVAPLITPSPPTSGVCISTMSQWIDELFPLLASS